MKLNLVPTHVAKEKASGGAIFVMLLLIAVGVVGAVFMVSYSGSQLSDAKSKEKDALDKASQVKTISDQADTLMGLPKTHAVVRNLNLYDAMQSHSAAYPNLYDTLRPYVPSYYRVTSMAASPGGPDTCVVTLTGVLTTYQQYADLGLAFMRVPGAQGYSPSGYQITDQYVPNLTPQDMKGRPIHPGDANVPDDELTRLAYLQQQGTVTRYTGDGGFGDPDQTTKGAMPNASVVTITITLKSDPKHNYGIQTPDPRTTLSSAAAAAATSSTGTGSPGAFGAPPPPQGTSTPAPPPPGVGPAGAPKAGT